MEYLKEFFWKIKAIYHIFHDGEYAVYSVTVKKKKGVVKRGSSCCIMSHNISHVFLDTIIDYSETLKKENGLGKIDKLINYGTRYNTLQG